MSATPTNAGFLVLGMVRRAGSATPYDIKRAAAQIAPFWSIPHTQIYAQCDKLVAAGLLRQSQEDDGRRRRVLTVTEEGEQVLAGWLGEGEFMPVEARDLGLLKLFLGADPAVIAPEQIEAHTRLAAKYQGMLDAGSLPAGPAATVMFGREYEKALVGFWSLVLDRSGRERRSDAPEH